MIEYRQVERRLLLACKTLRALPDKEHRYRIYGSYWPQTADDPNTSYGYADAAMPRFRPSPAAVSDCLVALEWVRGMPRRKFNFIWWRSFELSFHRIGCFIHKSHDTARQRYIESMREAWMIANTPKAVAS